jgi:hypothetical protein
MTGVMKLFSMANRFDRIARFYRTDKSSLGHNYSPYYQRHLGPRRFKRNLVFEIGVGGMDNPYSGGQSLRTWRDYLPRSTIVGIDIEAKDLSWLGKHIHVVQADQSNHDSWQEFSNSLARPMSCSMTARTSETMSSRAFRSSSQG